MTVHDLPKTYKVRWTKALKKLVVRAVSEGVVTLEWASKTYLMSIDEYLEWRAL